MRFLFYFLACFFLTVLTTIIKHQQLDVFDFTGCLFTSALVSVFIRLYETQTKETALKRKD
jgi:hypothetical protein